MTHNYISSKHIIDRIYTDYNIQSDDFVSRVPLWTLNAIREIGIKQTYVLSNVVMQLVNYKCALPKELERIYGVKIDGFTADSNFDLNVVNKYEYGDSNVVGFDGNTYTGDVNILKAYSAAYDPDESDPIILNEIQPDYGEQIPAGVLTTTPFDIRLWRGRSMESLKYKIVNGWLTANVETGKVEIACGVFPYLYDAEFEMIFPLIPDDENLIKAITFSILSNILMRGYKHALLSFTANNEFLNPGMGWTKYSKLARNSCNSLNTSDARTLTKLTGRNII